MMVIFNVKKRIFSRQANFLITGLGQLGLLLLLTACMAQGTVTLIGDSTARDNGASDTTPPTLSLSPSLSSSYVSSANQSSFSVSANCSEEGRPVSFTADQSGSLVLANGTCIGGVASANLNLSSYSDGGFNLSATQADAAGNSTQTSNLSLAKDTQAALSVIFHLTTSVINSEGDGTVNVQVDLSRVAIVQTKVQLALAGTATENTDYTNATGTTLTINPGDSSAQISISLTEDTSVEPVEYIDITLSSIVSGNATIGATSAQRILIKDNDPESLMQVVSGSRHNCVKFTDGKVKCWGRNAEGQLGIGDTANRGDDPNEMGINLPYVNLGTGVTVSKLSSGDAADNTCALLSSGDVKCWGYGSTWAEPGYMGYGNSNNIGDQSTEMGDNLPIINLGTGVKAKDLSSGSFNTCVITTDDRAKCWGTGFHGANGNASTARIGSSSAQMGDNLSYMDFGTGVKPIKIVMGSFHRCVLFDNLKVKCWGWNNDGQLGYEDTNTRGDNAGEMGDNLPFVNLGTNAEIVDIAAATSGYVESSAVHHSCALFSNGKVKCWGAGGSGRLGYENTTSRGAAAGTMGDNLPFINLGTGRTAKRIFASNGSTCAILDNNDLKCWGNGSSGQLGYNSTSSIGATANTMGDYLSAVFLGTGRYAISVSGSYLDWNPGHHCAVLDNYDVKCWGSNNSGELGTGDLNVYGDQANEMENLNPIPLQ